MVITTCRPTVFSASLASANRCGRLHSQFSAFALVKSLDLPLDLQKYLFTTIPGDYPGKSLMLILTLIE